MLVRHRFLGFGMSVLLLAATPGGVLAQGQPAQENSTTPEEAKNFQISLLSTESAVLNNELAKMSEDKSINPFFFYFEVQNSDQTDIDVQAKRIVKGTKKQMDSAAKWVIPSAAAAGGAFGAGFGKFMQISIGRSSLGGAVLACGISLGTYICLRTSIHPFPMWDALDIYKRPFTDQGDLEQTFVTKLFEKLQDKRLTLHPDETADQKIQTCMELYRSPDEVLKLRRGERVDPAVQEYDEYCSVPLGILPEVVEELVEHARHPETITIGTEE